MKTFSLLLATTLIGGLLLAQGPVGRGQRRGPDNTAKAGPSLGLGGGLDGGLLRGPNAERRLTRALSLNAEQQNQLHTAIAEQAVVAKGLPEKSQDLRQQLGAAVRADDEGKIDQITRDLAQVTQQQTAISAKTLAKVYKSLDASQKGVLERVLGPQLGLSRQRPGTPPPAAQ